jgi:hypothetical protein
MNAEKSTYMPHGTTKKYQSDYLDLLENTINGASLETLRPLLLEMVQHDRRLIYQLTVRLVPMSMDEAVALLKDAIEMIKGESALLSRNGQDEVAKITDALMAKSKEHLAKGQLLEAASACFAILLAVEPHVEDVTDEGHILQTIMKEAFGYLHAFPDTLQDPAVFSKLSETATLLLDSIPSEDRRYEREWVKVKERFGELV